MNWPALPVTLTSPVGRFVLVESLRNSVMVPCVTKKPTRMTSAGKMTSMKPLLKASMEPSTTTNGPATLLGDLTSAAMAPSGSKIPIGVPGFPTGSLKLAPPLLKNGDVKVMRLRELNWFAAGTVCPLSYDVIVKADRSSKLSVLAAVWNCATAVGSLEIRVSPDDAVGCTATRHIRTAPRIHSVRDALQLGEIMMASPPEAGWSLPSHSSVRHGTPRPPGMWEIASICVKNRMTKAPGLGPRDYESRARTWPIAIPNSRRISAKGSSRKNS